MIDLKPCPFCGNRNPRFRYYHDEERECFRIFVKCTSCHCRSGFVFGKENPSHSKYNDEATLKCAVLWNTRAE